MLPPQQTTPLLVNKVLLLSCQILRKVSVADISAISQSFHICTGSRFRSNMFWVFLRMMAFYLTMTWKKPSDTDLLMVSHFDQLHRARNYSQQDTCSGVHSGYGLGQRRLDRGSRDTQSFCKIVFICDLTFVVVTSIPAQITYQIDTIWTL